MLITILTTGSRGDTQPYVALGLELKKMGCDVRMVGFQNFESFVRSYGLDFYPIPGDVVSVAASISGMQSMRADNPLKLLFSFKKLQEIASHLQKDFYHACAGADVVVYHPGAAVGYFAAQCMGVPSVLAIPFPMRPTREYPSLIFYDMPRLGALFNLFSHKILQQLMWFGSSAPVKQFLKQEWGAVPAFFSSPFTAQTTHRFSTITSCSNYVFPRPVDWPENVHSSGYWFLDDAGDWTPPADLLDFLKYGAPPVYIGFGSIGDAGQAQQTTRLAIEALGQSGQRGILATGWSGMTKLDDLPANVFMLESAPHFWLFPRMAVVVHHGGAGTTAAGLRAGVPSIVIPSGNDQFAWGRRVYELGVGAQPIPRKKLTAEKLSAAITYALQPQAKRLHVPSQQRSRPKPGPATPHW